VSDPPSGPPSFFPIVIGFLLAGLLLLGLGLWVARRPARVQPRVTLISPARDTTINGPLQLYFESSIPLELMPTGWGNGPYHLHALVDSVEVMAGGTDVRPAGNGRYYWTLPALERPAHVQLVWALPNHGRLGTGASQRVRVAPR
jgi:hypothetical protein